MRRRKNGEIVAVKHVQFGWISPKQYYQLQKIHDLIPVIGPFIAGGYQLKWAIAQKGISIAGVDIPLGGLAYAEALALGAILCSPDPIKTTESIAPFLRFAIPSLTGEQSDKFRAWAFSEGSLLIAGVLLPFGEILLLWALGRLMTGQTYRWEDLLADVIWTLQGRPTIAGSGEHPGAPGPEGPGGHFPGPH